MKQYYKNIATKEVYFIGKDQKREKNLINAKSGSEYFLPGFFEEKELKQYFEPYPEYSEKWDILERTGNNWIPLNSIRDGQEVKISVNANITKVKRESDGAIFEANKYHKTEFNSFGNYISIHPDC